MSESVSEYSRRHALRIGGGVLALVIGGGAGWVDRRGSGHETATTTSSSSGQDSSTTEYSPTVTAPPDLVATLDLESMAGLDPAIADLGRRYMSEYPEEADLATLLDLLPRPTHNPIDAARSTISTDFRNGDTVTVAGWVLAASEARAAAVVALACPGSGDGKC